MDQFTAVRAFIRVVEAGSFVQAADSLRMPRNTVTKLIQSLEAHLHIKLLHRTTRRVSATNEGAAYYERMAPLLAEWQQAEAEATGELNNPRGVLRVDMGSMLAVQLVIPALASFHERYPDLQLEMGVSDRPVDLISDQVDCVVRAGKVTSPSLIARQICSLPFVLCASGAYLRQHGEPTHPADLEIGHLLVRYFFAGSRRYAPIELRRGDDLAIVRGHHFVSVNDGNASLAAATAGLGILHTVTMVAQPYIERGELLPILSQWTAEPVPISVAYAENRHLSSRVTVFIAWIEQLFQNQS
jgi:DNA-binding transcriptional LysR family regulator